MPLRPSGHPHVVSTRWQLPCHSDLVAASMSFRPGASRGEVLPRKVSEAAVRLRLLTFVRSDMKGGSK